MSKPKKQSLDRILYSDRLLSGIAYDNVDRDEGEFYSYVESYASKLGLKLITRHLGFRDTVKLHKQDMQRSTTRLLSGGKVRADGVWDFCDGILGITVYPLLYPILGGTYAAISLYEGKKEIRITLPKYGGLIPDWRYGNKIHEFYHANQMCVYVDLKRRGYIPKHLDFHNILKEDITPLVNVKVPDHYDLKRNERDFVTEIQAISGSRNN